MSAQGATQESVAPSQAETLMSTQDAKERAETRAVAKGKAKEVQVVLPSPSKPQSSMGPPAKPGQPQAQETPNKPSAPALTTTPAVAAISAPATTPASTTAATTTPASKKTTVVTSAAPNTPADVPSVTPLKRGPGRPRKSEKLEPTGLPALKRLRGRPRNSTTPAANTRQKARDEIEEGSDDGEYHGSDESSSEALPPNIMSQYTAHVGILRTRLDTRGIPEQYSLFKSFWVPIRSPYFDGGASGPPGRFVYWDPLFITSVGCPVCQQPLAIAAGGGWLDEPLSMRDEEGPCWIIGRRYVCTQCFAATEVAARYVNHGDLDHHDDSDPDPSGPSKEDIKPKSIKIDFSSTVYYLSWEKRFRELLPDTLAAEFPTRVKKRAVKEKEKDKEKEKEKEPEKDEEDEEDEDAEGEMDAEEAETPKRLTKRARHCMKCGSKACQGRMGRSRCPNACYDCGSTDCNGRPKPNITCKGDIVKAFRELNTDESGSPITETSTASALPPAVPAAAPAPASDPAPLPQPSIWPAGLPEVPPGYVLAIPYAVGADGKPAGAGPGMAYLVPKGDVPGFMPLPAATTKPETAPTAAEASSSTESSAAPAPTPAADAPAAAPPAQPAAPKRNPPRAKATSQKAAAQPAQPQLATGPGPTPPRPHHPYPAWHAHPPSHPHAHPQSGGPESGYYGGYYAPYGYPPPYGYGFYPPYPPQHQPHGENGAPPQQQHPGPPPAHPQSHYYPGQQPGFVPPQAQPGYGPPPPGAYGPAPPPTHDAPSHPPANGYPPPPPAGGFQQPQQYIPYQPHAPVTSAGGPATKKRKTGAAAAAEADKTT